MEYTFDQTGKLISSLFPDLIVRKIEVLGEGWDSKAILVNNRIVFRIPKHITASRRMEKEIQILRAIRPYLFSAQIPDIKWIGSHDSDFPVSAVGYQMIEGIPFSNINQMGERNRVFHKIGQFLNELYAVPKSVLQSTEVPWFRWTGDLSTQGPNGWEEGLLDFTERIYNYAIPLLSKATANEVDKEINTFQNSKQNLSFEPVLLHGDLAQEHILVNEDNEDTDIIGVIDFGDSGLGDPAYDVWPQLTPYYSSNRIDETFKTRQQFYRRLAPFHSVIYGLLVKDDGLVAKALKEIER